jgi:hypothetical protein
MLTHRIPVGARSTAFAHPQARSNRRRPGFGEPPLVAMGRSADAPHRRRAGRLTVTHEREGAPRHAEQVAGDIPLEQGGGGWPWILSDVKSLLETGKSIAG